MRPCWQAERMKGLLLTEMAKVLLFLYCSISTHTYTYFQTTTAKIKPLIKSLLHTHIYPPNKQFQEIAIDCRDQ